VTFLTFSILNPKFHTEKTCICICFYGNIIYRISEKRYIINLIPSNIIQQNLFHKFFLSNIIFLVRRPLLINNHFLEFFFKSLNLLSITMVEAILVGAREINFNELRKLNIDNLIVTHDKVFNIHGIFCNVCDQRTLLINNIVIFVFLAAHMFSKPDLRYAQHKESRR